MSEIEMTIGLSFRTDDDAIRRLTDYYERVRQAHVEKELRQERAARLIEQEHRERLIKTDSR